MDAVRERELLDVTGRWPPLLNLVNHRLAGEVRRGAGAARRRTRPSGLREHGSAVFDIPDPGQRQTAVDATIGYSLDVLDPGDRDRFTELSVFAEDAEIPLAAVALLWQGCACRQLDRPGFLGGRDLWGSWGSWHYGRRIPRSCGERAVAMLLCDLAGEHPEGAGAT
jgi:hypothetical protein